MLSLPSLPDAALVVSWDSVPSRFLLASWGTISFSSSALVTYEWVLRSCPRLVRS